MPWLPSYVTVDELPGGRLEIVIRESRLWRFFVCILLLAAFVWIQYLDDRVTPLAAVLVYLGMVWLMGVFTANTRTLHVSRAALRVSHSPFPWIGRHVPARDLEQLWVDEEHHRNDYTYRLRARVRGRNITLVRFIPDASAALHLERRIEQFLGIADRPVEGEIIAR